MDSRRVLDVIEATFTVGGLLLRDGVTDARRLRQLEVAIGTLKQMVENFHVDRHMLQNYAKQLMTTARRRSMV